MENLVDSEHYTSTILALKQSNDRIASLIKSYEDTDTIYDNTDHTVFKQPPTHVPKIDMTRMILVDPLLDNFEAETSSISDVLEGGRADMEASLDHGKMVSKERVEKLLKGLREIKRSEERCTSILIKKMKEKTGLRLLKEKEMEIKVFMTILERELAVKLEYLELHEADENITAEEVKVKIQQSAELKIERYFELINSQQQKMQDLFSKKEELSKDAFEICRHLDLTLKALDTEAQQKLSHAQTSNGSTEETLLMPASQLVAPTNPETTQDQIESATPLLAIESTIAATQDSQDAQDSIHQQLHDSFAGVTLKLRENVDTMKELIALEKR